MKGEVRYSTLVVGTLEVEETVNVGTRRKPVYSIVKKLVPWDMFAPGNRPFESLRGFIKQYRFATIERIELWQINDKTRTAHVLHRRQVNA